MDGEHGFRAPRDAACDVVWIEVHRRGVDVREDRCCAPARDRLGGGVEGERRTDDFVARSDAERVHDEHQGVRAVRHADGLAHAEVAGGLALERADVRAQDELATREHALDHLAHAGQERLVLRLYVNQRDRRHGQQV